MKTVKNSLNDNHWNDLNDMTTGIGIFNNYSSLLNNMVNENNRESIRAIVLMVTDVIDLAAKSKIAKSVNNGVQSGAMSG